MALCYAIAFNLSKKPLKSSIKGWAAINISLFWSEIFKGLTSMCGLFFLLVIHHIKVYNLALVDFHSPSQGWHSAGKWKRQIILLSHLAMT